MQNTIFARARRGELPAALSIADLCRLSTASLDCPHGRYAPGDDLARRLHQLVGIGEIVPERTEAVQYTGMFLASFGGREVKVGGGTYLEHVISAASLRDALPELGEAGPLFSAWVCAGAVEGTATTATKRAQTPWYVERVTAFCEAITASGVIDPDKPGFTAEALAEAMGVVGLWRRHGVTMPKSTTLRRHAAEVAAKWFMFPNGRPEGDAARRHKQAVGRLIALYRLAVSDENQEPGNRAPPVSASNIRRAAG